MFKTLIANLSKPQKITVFLVVQVLFILLVISMIQTFTKEKEHVEIQKTNDGSQQNIPDNTLAFVGENVWSAIKNNVQGVSKSVIKDAVIRDGSYVETKNEDGSVFAEFLLDIDSIKQTYAISTGWSKDRSVTYEVSVSCPRKEDMKYPDSICYSAYNSTYSLDMYLPYQIDSPYAEEFDYAGPELYISGDEEAKKIYVSLSPCSNADEYRKKADEYLQTIPKIEEYKIEYITRDGVDVVCPEDL